MGVGESASFVSTRGFIDSVTQGMDVVLAIRPEEILVSETELPEQGNGVKGSIDALLFIGDKYECHVKVGEHSILAFTPNTKELREGQTVNLYFPKEAVSLWPK